MLAAKMKFVRLLGEMQKNTGLPWLFTWSV